MKHSAISEWSEPVLQSIQSHIAHAQDRYLTLPEEVLTAVPADGGWSAAQCFAHLDTYGDFYLPRAIKALGQVANSDKSGSFRSGFLGKLLINTIKPSNKLKLKALKPNQPAEKPNGIEAVSQFIRHQQEWLSLLQKIERFDQLNARVTSSISPLVRFKLGDVFGFMTAHDARHIQQADRALAETGMKV